MYNNTRTRGDDNTTLAALACRAFVGLSVTVSVIGFWSKGVLPAVLLTVAMVVVVYLLSISLSRLVQAANARAWRTVTQTAVMALGFVTIEAALNHIGLEHMNETFQLIPAAFIWPACWFVSFVNVFATETYTRELAGLEQGGAMRSQEIKQPTLLLRSKSANLTQWNEWQAHRRQKESAEEPFAEAMAHIRSRVKT